MVERRRASSRAWNLAHRKQMAEAQRRYAETHREELRASTRRWYRAMRQDPERLEHFRETQRMGRRLKLERDGRPMQPVPEERYPAASSKWTADAEPVRQLVRDWISSGGTSAELAKSAGVSERLLYRLLHEDGNVSVAAADRIVVALGLHLDLLYEAGAVA